MKTFFEKAIKYFEELIVIRAKISEILSKLGNTKDASAIQFKISNYKKWISAMNAAIKNNIQITSKDDIAKIDNIKDKLMFHLSELFDIDTIKEVEKAKQELVEIEKQSVSVNVSVSSGLETRTETTFTIQNSINTKSIIKPTKSTAIAKVKPTKTHSDSTSQSTSKSASHIDTSVLEAQPKILSDEVRPTDLRGGIIYDLRYIHGVGPKNAEKLADMGITLEGLLSEWKSWSSKEPSNSILMPSRMPRPPQYNERQWESFSKDKRFEIQESIFKKKISSETKQLCKIHRSSIVGLKYFNDMLSEKIPRAEIQIAETILKRVAVNMNSKLLVMICGSYRRGRDKSGDIDCLIAHPDIKTKFDLDNSPINILSSFVEVLMNVNFIVDQIDMGMKKFMGFCKLIQKTPTQPNPAIARRLDIRFVPYESYGSAILYFTGSKKFNTNMRSHALQKGYSLNEFGLTKISDNTIIPCFTEETVFKILDYPYKKPEERDI